MDFQQPWVRTVGTTAFWKGKNEGKTTFALFQSVSNVVAAVFELRLGGFELLERRGQVLDFLGELILDLVQLGDRQRGKIDW